MKLPNLVGQLFERNFRHFLAIYFCSLLIVIAFHFRYEKLGLLLVVFLFNLNSLFYTRLCKAYNVEQENNKERSDRLDRSTTDFEWLQMIIDQRWSGGLVVLFQKELNKFYTKNRNTEYKFYHFYLNENSPPRIEQMHIPSESRRTDEVVIHSQITIVGTVLLKLNEDEKDKGELALISLLIDKYGFKRKFQAGTYQDANLKKKNFLTKELCLNARSRLILRPLTNSMPYFTSLNFTLLDYPLMYSTDKRDVYESSNEFEHKFYNYLIECICLPFLHPNRLILLYAHREHIKHEHGLLFKQKLSEANQFMQNKLRKAIKHKRKVNDFIQELNDKKILNWYKSNVVKNLDLVELNLNCSTFHPFPLFVVRIKLIEIEHIVPDSVIFIRFRIGQLSIAKVRLINSASPILNLITLLPVHDYYEQCTIQIIQIKSSKYKQVKKCTGELNTAFWNQKLSKLPKNDPLIRPIGELTFPIDKRTFDYDEATSLNGQDFWLPLDGLKQAMIHLSCACFKLSSAYRTIRKVSKITRSLTIAKSDLNDNQLPVAFIKVYVENFVCTYKKDNKLKTRRNQFNQLQFSFSEQKKTVDLMKLTKTRLIFRSSCHFFAYDDPFSFDVIVELLDKNKRGDRSKSETSQDNKIRLINLIKLSDYKKSRAELYHNESLPVFIVNNKDFNNVYMKDRQNANFKLIDREEYGKLSMNLFIRFIYLDHIVLQKLLLAPEIRGYNVETKKRPVAKTTKQDKTLLTLDKRKKSLKTDECVGKLYFKLVNGSMLEVGVLNVTNVPYDKTKRIKLQVIIELWKGNYKVTTKKTPFTDILHNPTFDSAFQFLIESANLQQYAIRFVVVQRSGFLRSVFKIIADRFCTIPLLTLDVNFVIRSYILKTDKKTVTKKLI